VKSPVASLCLDCSSVKNRVRVTMSMLIFSAAPWSAPLEGILEGLLLVFGKKRNKRKKRKRKKEEEEKV
jgi:hypothetical protein